MLNIFVKFDDFSINIFCSLSMAGIQLKVKHVLGNCHLKMKSGLFKIEKWTLVDKIAFCWHS